ncbi:MAG: hypothetical protein JST54_17545 [Deltaproteobacteria bacterium]|nr:hypothetical protein [Deltaproteobacteria bacterium]
MPLVVDPPVVPPPDVVAEPPVDPLPELAAEPPALDAVALVTVVVVVAPPLVVPPEVVAPPLVVPIVPVVFDGGHGFPPPGAHTPPWQLRPQEQTVEQAPQC